MPRKVIIDTDPGVDDAMAIYLALASPELEVLALTTIFGNAGIDTTTRNALTLLEIAGRSDIPVGKGQSSPLTVDYLGPVPHVHGQNGLGDAPLNPPIGTIADQSAADLIGAIVRANPGEVTLLAVGPLTNLAIALERHPSIASQVAQVIVMGGNALGPGNATPVAEANINNDPEAADTVFGADWPVTMVGLDVTHQVILTSEALDRIAANPSPVGELLRVAMPLYRRFYETTNHIDGIFVHDPTAVAALLDPDAFVVNEWPLRVETQSFSRGKTWPNMGNTDDPVPPAWQGRPPVRVCTGVDGARIAALVEQRLTTAGQPD